MKTLWMILMVLGLNTASATAAVQDPCLLTEHWELKTTRNSHWLKEFHEFSANRSTPIFAWTRAIQLKKMSEILTHAELESDFSEYWVARILYELKIDVLAHQAFTSVLENSENADLKKASYSCLNRIQMRTPDLLAPKLSTVAPLAWDENDSDVLFPLLLREESALSKKLSPLHKNFLEGVRALQNKKYSDAVFAFQTFFKLHETKSNAILDKYLDEAHLFFGRALYSVARFAEANQQFQLVKKTSNLQIEAMSNMAWSYLMSEKYDDAIGVSLQLRTGALKNAFSPEPMMVAAMALNELCNYPDSIRMIQAFVHDYQPSFEWLRANQKSNSYYGLVLNTLKGKKEGPNKLLTEWLRSPEFLTRQTEINTLIGLPQQFRSIEKTAENEQNKMTDAFLEKSNQFTKDVKVAKLQLKPGEELNPAFADRYHQLKKDLRKLSQFYRASKNWKTLSKSFEKKLPAMRTKLVDLINRDLSKKGEKTLALLNHVRDNCDLIEVEIYNGASQDLVWKNAHPTYDTESAELSEQKTGPDHAKTWSWGRFTVSNLEDAEVWEDELGALKADVSNQCGQKEKFLKVGTLKKGAAK